MARDIGNSIDITAEDQWTDEIFIGQNLDGTLSISGVWTAILTLQYRLKNSDTWVDRDTTDAMVDGIFKEEVVIGEQDAQ